MTTTDELEHLGLVAKPEPVAAQPLRIPPRFVNLRGVVPLFVALPSDAIRRGCDKRALSGCCVAFDDFDTKRIACAGTTKRRIAARSNRRDPSILDHLEPLGRPCGTAMCVGRW
jgi:hypothetical protein